MLLSIRLKILIFKTEIMPNFKIKIANDTTNYHQNKNFPLFFDKNQKKNNKI